MKNFYKIIAALFFVAAFSVPIFNANATSGACSGHSGVDCSAGADWDGSVICNDGWRNSSVSYSSMVMCRSYGSSYSTQPSCPTMSSYDSLSGQCKCMSGYVVDTDYSGKQTCTYGLSYCMKKYGYHSNYDSLDKSCGCDRGYVMSGDECISNDKLCTNKFGYNAEYDSLKEECVCKKGYHAEGGYCKRDVSLDSSYSILPYLSSGYSSGVSSSSGSVSNTNVNTPVIVQCGENQSRDYSTNTCFCVAGFTMVNGVCITENAQCMSALGQNAYYNSNSKQCACSQGYLFNNETGKCIVDQVAFYNALSAQTPAAPVSQITETVVDQPAVLPPPVAKQYLTVTSKVNIRKSPSTKSGIVGKAATKTKYEITDLSVAGWVKIKFGDKEGYVSKNYVKLLK